MWVGQIVQHPEFKIQFRQVLDATPSTRISRGRRLDRWLADENNGQDFRVRFPQLVDESSSNSMNYFAKNG